MRYTIKKAHADVLKMCGQNDLHVTIEDNKIVMDPTSLILPVNWRDWLIGLKFTALVNQEGKCICGEQLRDEGELHHALVTKADLSGYRDDAKNKILHHTYNVVLCHQRCHTGLVRRRCLVFLRELYGEKVIAWYENIPAKSFMRRTM